MLSGEKPAPDLCHPPPASYCPSSPAGRHVLLLYFLQAYVQGNPNLASLSSPFKNIQADAVHTVLHTFFLVCSPNSS